MRLFLHMPKCAGTSVFKVLNTMVGDRITIDRDSFFRRPRSLRYAKIAWSFANPTRVSGEKIVYGHFFPVKYIGMGLRLDYKLVTIIREPIERLFSHYNYWKKNPDSEHYLCNKMIKQKWSFIDFAGSPEMKNFYAQHFVGFSLNRFSYIGLSDNIAESFRRCCEELSINADGAEEIPRLNMAEHPLRLALGTDMIEKLKAHHAKDYMIYERVRRKFHS